jgi:hypothetical protein
MSKLVALTAVLVVAFAATAFATDLRSPDARESGRFVISPPSSQPQPVDLRSPDARESGRFVITPPPGQQATQNDSFDWGYLAAGVALACVLGTGIVLVARRRRSLPIGG